MEKERILVIEDEIDVLKNLEEILTEEGYKVFTAKNGKTGIKTALAEKPDMIICDISMPGLDGYGVLKELSGNSSTKAIPFLFLTAKVEKEDIRKGMLLGADDYILKPFTIEDLINSIRSRLKRMKVLKSVGKVEKEKSSPAKYSEGDKFFIRVNDQPQLIYVKDIVFIGAENQYTMLNLADEKTYLVRKSISKWLEALPSSNFIRIHRSTIINIDYIQKIEKWYNSSFAIHLKNIPKSFIVSKRYSAKLRQNIF